MKYEEYAELKKDVEIYFAEIIKKRFKEYVEENSSLHFSPHCESHNLITDLLRNDGLDVFGMNVNMDGFQLLLDFGQVYLTIDNFPFTRIEVDFNNDGNYSVYLGDNSFNNEWTIRFEDEFNRYSTINEADFVEMLSHIKNTHLILILKS